VAIQNLSQELDTLAFELDSLHDFRRLLCRRLVAITAGVVLLAAIHVFPWIAVIAAAGITVALNGMALRMEATAKRRLTESALIRHLQQTDSQPRVP
jgi:hypothetical protein